MFMKNIIKDYVYHHYLMFNSICQAGKRFYHYVQRKQMTNLREILAHNLKEKRRNCGFSQAKLAEMVDVSTHHIATIETARNYPALDLIERMANVLDIEIYELFINPLSPPEEMEQLYQIAAKNIDQMIRESMERHSQMIRESIERHYQTTAKNIERVVGEAVEKILTDKFHTKK
jgi:DNA-binding XRE family transcriptional regulator